jgi:hypothetical protein
MAKVTFAASFQLTPDQDALITVDGFGTVFVQVTNLDPQNTRFQATLKDISGNTLDQHDLVHQAGTAFWWYRLYAGPVPNNPPSADNRTIQVQAYQGTILGDSDSHDFMAYLGGSGSASVAGSIRQNQCGSCSTATPVPVLLQLMTDSAGILSPSNIETTAQGCPNCAALNTDVFLQHCADPAMSCSWISCLIDFCGSDSGYWQLQKTTARNWQLTLLLQDGATGIVRYTATTAVDLDCSFPLELSNPTDLTDPPSCVNWPAVVTVAPAA